MSLHTMLELPVNIIPSMTPRSQQCVCVCVRVCVCAGIIQDTCLIWGQGVMLRISLVSQVLPACQTWYDHVWAYFKTLVDVQVEKVTVGHTVTACCDTVCRYLGADTTQ